MVGPLLVLLPIIRIFSMTNCYLTTPVAQMLTQSLPRYMQVRKMRAFGLELTADTYLVNMLLSSRLNLCIRMKDIGYGSRTLVCGLKL